MKIHSELSRHSLYAASGHNPLNGRKKHAQSFSSKVKPTKSNNLSIRLHEISAASVFVDTLNIDRIVVEVAKLVDWTLDRRRVVAVAVVVELAVHVVCEYECWRRCCKSHRPLLLCNSSHSGSVVVNSGSAMRRQPCAPSLGSQHSLPVELDCEGLQLEWNFVVSGGADGPKTRSIFAP